MSTDSKSIFENYPEIIQHSIILNEPNQNILIHDGEFELKYKDKTMTLKGKISFDWLPQIRVRYDGELINGRIQSLTTDLKISIFVNGEYLGDCNFTRMRIGNVTNISGYLIDEVIKGDKSIPVTKVKFVIANLKEFLGKPIKATINEKIYLCKNRLVFSTHDYILKLDLLPNPNALLENLESKGGYQIFYHGEILKQHGSIYHKDIETLSSGFSLFLSFLNGRRCSLLFMEGLYNDEKVWTDFTPKKLDLFKTVFSWSTNPDDQEYEILWKNFYSVWIDPNGRSFLKSVIHWYIEANKNSAFLEGSIIMTQIGLELVYNWFVIEKRKLLLGKDSESISASNKIRLLLSQLQLESEIPKSLKKLSKYTIDNKIPDGIEAFVQIRNALVHSHEDKREKLMKIPEDILYEVLTLGLWYLELSILKALDFKGIYQSRCTSNPMSGNNRISVPWIKK